MEEKRERTPSASLQHQRRRPPYPRLPQRHPIHAWVPAASTRFQSTQLALAQQQRPHPECEYTLVHTLIVAQLQVTTPFCARLDMHECRLTDLCHDLVVIFNDHAKLVLRLWGMFHQARFLTSQHVPQYSNGGRR
jgi:hypothetical protein